MNINTKFLIFSVVLISIINALSKNNSKLLLRCEKKCHNKKNKIKKFCKKCLDLEIKNEIKISKDESSVILLSNSNIFHYNEIKNLIVFGDSHSAVGTNFTDMTYTGENKSLGKNWPLYLKEFNNMTLWNYAIGGSVVDNNLVKKEKWERSDFKKQYEYFKENMSKGKKFDSLWNKKNSLFSIWIGTRDIRLIYKKNVINEIDEITSSLFDTINKIYEVGARNLLIFDAFPHYKNPYCINGKCDNIINQHLIFKSNIIKKSKLFFEKHIDVNIIIYNTVDLIKEILSNCKGYKFKDCTHAWINEKEYNINDYFWVNTHITDLANKYLAININYLLNSINKMY